MTVICREKKEYIEYVPMSLRGKSYVHSPTLETVVMVEETIKKLDYYPTKAELKREMPKKIMHQTLNIILSYLEQNSKIIIDKGRIVWIFAPHFTKKILKEGASYR